MSLFKKRKKEEEPSIWEEIQNVAKSLSEPSEELTNLKNKLAQPARASRVLHCPKVAAVTICDTKGGLVENIFTRTETERRERDVELANILTSVLHADMEADLSPYEKAFSVKILKVQPLRPGSAGGIYVSDV